MPPVGFEPTISAGEQPQTYASDRADTGTGRVNYYYHKTPAPDTAQSNFEAHHQYFTTKPLHLTLPRATSRHITNIST